MMATRTPDWQLDVHDDGSFCIVGGRLGHNPLVMCSRGPITHRAEESKANAHMMFAAPDLYQALADTITIARIKYGNLDPDANVIFAKADAALAKARGENP